MNRPGSKGKPINSGQRKTVLNVVNYFQNYYPQENNSLKVKRTSQVTCQSERSIYGLRQEKEKGVSHTQKKSRKIESIYSKRDCFFIFSSPHVNDLVKHMFCFIKLINNQVV